MNWHLWLPVALSWTPLLCQVGFFVFIVKPYDRKYFEGLSEFDKSAEDRAIWVQKNNMSTLAKLEKLAKSQGGGYE
jgi:hypothetical protein